MAASFGPPARALASAGALALAAAGPPPATACAPLAAPLAGALALVLRSNCTFAVKARPSPGGARTERHPGAPKRAAAPAGSGTSALSCTCLPMTHPFIYTLPDDMRSHYMCLTVHL